MWEGRQGTVSGAGGARDQADSGHSPVLGPWLAAEAQRLLHTWGEWVEPQSQERPANLRRRPLEAEAFHPSRSP